MKNSNRIKLHRMFGEVMSANGLQGKYNAIVVGDPWEFLNCKGVAGYPNFEHVVKDDVLVYAEICNSVPTVADGRTIIDWGLLGYRDRMSRIVFGEGDIAEMGRMVAGKWVCSPVYYEEMNKCGEFVDGWTWKENVDGRQISILCGMAWVDRQKFLEYYFKSDACAHFAFSVESEGITCCKCGRTVAVPTVEAGACRHILAGGKIVCSPKSIVGFFMVQ